MIKYAITDPSFFNPTNSNDYIRYKDVDFVLFRDKTAQCYSRVANAFMINSKGYNFKSILHQDYMLAKELNSFGVHLTSKQFIAIKRAKELGLFVIVSTHSLEEVLQAQESGADAVTFSPIFETPKKGKPKGIEVLEELVNIAKDIKVIALGGIITKEHIKQIKQANPWGFASIRYFK